MFVSVSLRTEGLTIANFNQGLFGMNINTLDQHPSWTWYIAFSIPVMAILILVWVIFKYTSVSHSIRSDIDQL